MILMLGDVHGDIRHLLPLIEAERPAAVIFLGDIESPAPFEQFVAEIMTLTEVWWIPGNHDTDNEAHYAHLYASPLAERNLHGRVATIDGRRVAGLGGVFRGHIWYPPGAPTYLSYDDMVRAKFRHKRNLSHTILAGLNDLPPSAELAPLLCDGQLRKHRSSIFHADWQGLQGQRADLLVTHEAPSCHPHGFREIDTLGRALGIERLFHGHQHDSLDYRSHTRQLGFAAHGVGFRGVSDDRGRVLLAGSNDSAPCSHHTPDRKR